MAAERAAGSHAARAGGRALAPGVRWLLGLASLAALQLLLAGAAARERAFGPLWGAVFALTLVPAARRLARGALLDPAVALGGTYAALLGLGAVLFAQLRENPLSPWVSNAIGVGYCALWIGCELGRTLRARPPREEPGASRHGVELLVFGLLACAAATAALFVLFGGVPLFSDDPDEARIAFLSGRGELGVFLVGLPVVAYAFLYQALARGARGGLAGAHALAATTFLVLLSLGGRARALLFVLGYVGLALLLCPRRLSLVRLGLAFVGGVALLGVVGAVRRGGSARPEDVVAELGIAVLALPAMLGLIEQRLQPGDFQAGLFDDLATLLPGRDTGANVELKYAVFPNWQALPDSAGVNPSLVGEAYLHFGDAGVVWLLFAVGLVCGALYARLGPRPGFLAAVLYVFVLTGAMAAVSAGIGIRLTHLVQQSAWTLALTLVFLRRRAPTVEVPASAPPRPAS